MKDMKQLQKYTIKLPCAREARDRIILCAIVLLGHHVFTAIARLQEQEKFYINTRQSHSVERALKAKITVVSLL